MAEKVKGVPEGTHSITAHLIVNDGSKAVEWYKKAFGATIAGVHLTPDGKVMHAEVKIGDSRLMLADEFPALAVVRRRRWGQPRGVESYSEDVDHLFNRRLPPAQPLPCRWQTSSGATATARSPILSVTAGRWDSMWKTLRRRDGAPRQGSFRAHCRNRPTKVALLKSIRTGKQSQVNQEAVATTAFPT